MVVIIIAKCENALCNASSSIGGSEPYGVQVVRQNKQSTQKTSGSSSRFVPASIYPYGGFGDPEVPRPYRRIPKGTASDNALQAVAQDQIARQVRIALAEIGMTENQLEDQLDYRRYGLARKLNGHEQLTMRDVVRLGTIFDASLFAPFSSIDSNEQSAVVVSEEPAKYSKTVSGSSKSDSDVQELMVDASENLKKAASFIKSNSKQQESLADALNYLAKSVLSIGLHFRTPPNSRRKVTK